MNARHPRTGKSLPRYEVLELAAKLNDSEVDADPQLQAWLSELTKAKVIWHAAIADFDVIRFRVAAIPSEIEKAKAEISEIEAKRPSIIAQATLGNGDFSSDEELIKRRSELLLKIERITLSAPAIDSVMRQKNAVVAETARPVQSIEDSIAERRRELKLAEAERRCA
ncbi:MAG: hypothetical protein Q8S26_01915 [Azonexus sp.]|nr:hypothetical protein [Azonexus sp.]